jgi:CheY-like chemotaxis protein
MPRTAQKSLNSHAAWPSTSLVLDLNIPRLDGVQAARLLLGLQPSMSVALHSSDPDRLRARAAGLGLPLFDKLDFDDLVAWVEQQARAFAGRTPRSTASRLELSCSLCGYGIVSGAPPPQCPMCHAVAAWRKPDRVRHAAAPDHAVR